MNLIILIAFSILVSTDKVQAVLYVDLITRTFAGVLKSGVYVDKTMFLKTAFNYRNLLISAPMGIGKSTNLDMLRNFLSLPVDSRGCLNNTIFVETRRLFEPFQIYTQERRFFNDHFGQYPILYLEFMGSQEVTSVSEAFKTVWRKVHEFFTVRSYLCTNDKLDPAARDLCMLWCDPSKYSMFSPDDVRASLKTATDFLYRHFDGRQVYVMIDEFDAMLTNEMFLKNNDATKPIVSLLCDVLSGVVDENPSVEGVVMTSSYDAIGAGVLRLDNVEQYKFLQRHPVSGFFGFTNGEVDELCTTLNVSRSSLSFRNFRDVFLCPGGELLYSNDCVLTALRSELFRMKIEAP